MNATKRHLHVREGRSLQVLFGCLPEDFLVGGTKCIELVLVVLIFCMNPLFEFCHCDQFLRIVLNQLEILDRKPV